MNVDTIKDIFMIIISTNEKYRIAPYIDLQLDGYRPAAEYNLLIPEIGKITKLVTKEIFFEFSSGCKWIPQISSKFTQDGVNFCVYFVNNFDYNNANYKIARNVIFISCQISGYFSSVTTCLYAYEIVINNNVITLKPYIITNNSNRMLTSQYKSTKPEQEGFCSNGLLEDYDKKGSVVANITELLQEIFNDNKTMFDDYTAKLNLNKNIHLSFLSKGTYGHVNLVDDNNIKSKYAVKTLSRDYEKPNLTNKQAQNNFKQEAKTINLLSPKDNCNPYIVCEQKCAENMFLIDFLNKNSFCMEYIDGITVSDLIYGWSNNRKTNEKYINYVNIIQCDFNKLLQIFMDIAQGLKVLHDKDLIYRDLKPENIMLYIDKTNNVRAKLVDLGMVCGRETNISCNGIAGTPGYIDWSVFTNKISSKNTDIYSLGIVFLRCSANFSNYCSKNINNFNKSNNDLLLDKIHSLVLMNGKTELNTIKIYNDDLTKLVKNIITAESDNKSVVYSKSFNFFLKMILPDDRPIISDVITQLRGMNNGVKLIEPVITQMHGGSKNTINYEHKYKKYKQKYLDLKNTI